MKIGGPLKLFSKRLFSPMNKSRCNKIHAVLGKSCVGGQESMVLISVGLEKNSLWRKHVKFLNGKLTKSIFVEYNQTTVQRLPEIFTRVTKLGNLL